MPANTFIAVGTNAAENAPILLISGVSDASSWVDNSAAAASAFPTAVLNAVCFNSSIGRWVVGGYDSNFGTGNNAVPVILYSDDGGNTWTAPSLPQPTLGLAIASVCWDGVKFIATGPTSQAGSNPAVLNSSDGITWTDRTPGSQAGLLWGSGVAGTSSFDIAVGANQTGGGIGIIFRSTNNGNTWSQVTFSAGTISQLNGIVLVPGGTHVAVGWTNSSTHGGITTSPDGNTWTVLTTGLPSNQSYYSIAWNGSIYAAVGMDFNTNVEGRAISSTDAITWTNRATDPPGPVNTFDGPNWLSVTAQNQTGGGFVAVGRDNNVFNIPYIMYSADGITWTARANPIGAGNGILNGVGAGITAGPGPPSSPYQPYGLLGVVDYET